MRINIVIDDALMTEALAVSGATTKRKTVDLALRALIRLRAQEEIKSLRGTIEWRTDLEAMRFDRWPWGAPAGSRFRPVPPHARCLNAASNSPTQAR